jgi:hypothetical protein
MLSIYGLLTRCPVRAGRDRRARRRSRVLFDGGKGALIEGYVDLVKLRRHLGAYTYGWHARMNPPI